MLKSLAVLLTLCFASIASLRGAPLPQDQDQGGGYENFSPEQLDNLLSPIALYPDPLLAQVFVAATFPDQVEEAARYVREYGQNGVDDQNWDVSVRAVAHYPTVIEMMSGKIDWTTSLGQAYVNQSTDVASSVQRLRHQARHAGNLDSSPQEEVIENGDYIAITPYQPQFIYVPVYDPAIIYFRRPYWGPAITFGVGYPIGAWLNLDFRWGYGGGWGGVYYTGWRREGWGGGCWNCGWIGRSRDHVEIRNNVYINNRYTNITVNRTVINRTVNVNNINRYNYVHRDVRYDNVAKNNVRVATRDTGPGENRPRGNRPGDYGRQGNAPGGDNRGSVNNKIIDRNIGNNSRIDQYRGRDNSNNNVRNDRPPNTMQQNRPAQGGYNNPGGNNNARFENRNPGNNNNVRLENRNPAQPQGRPSFQPSENGGPHTFNRNENNFDPRVTSQRGQSSREQAARPQPPPRPAPQPRAENRPAPQQHGGGERKRP